MAGQPEHEALLAELTRRGFLARATAAGLAGLVAAALPYVGRPPGASAAQSTADATLQAFADTIIPGRKAGQTQSGASIDPLAIAGVDSQAGAVEADSLAVYHHPDVGFDVLEGAFLTDLEARSVSVGGGDFLHLPFDKRVQVCLSGLDLSNSSVLVWEAAAAVPFTAFCAAALVRNATAQTAVGYAVMGLPGVAPGGYADFSFRRALAPERTVNGSLP